MSVIAEIFKSLSVICIITSAVWILVPNGKMQNSMKYSIGMFAVCAALGCIMSLSSKLPVISFSKTDSDNIQASIHESVEKTNYSYAINSLLESSGIRCEKILIDTDISENGSINITNISIVLKNPDDYEKADSVIFSQTGLHPRRGQQ